MTIYKTFERPGFGKSWHWYEYRLKRGVVIKYKCSRVKIFDGKENNWEESEREVSRWSTKDPSMPDWLKKYL